MKKHPISALIPDHYFTKSLHLDERYILLSPETPVTRELIDRLRQWSYESVESEGVAVENPIAFGGNGGEAISLSIVQDIKETTLFREAESYYNELLGFVERVFTNFVTRNEISERQIGEMVKRATDLVRSHRRYILRLSEMKARDKNYIVAHSSKTTIVAIAIGTTLKLPSHKLIELGTAAVLHEIGMIRLPPQLYMSSQKLSEKERRAISAHTVLGFKTLRAASFPMSVCLAVLECRENIDGTGYPRQLTGEKIGLYAKILMVAGSFAAITSPRPYRDALDGHSAMLAMLQQRGKAYDETVLKALVTNLSIYPIGTHVELADGTRGMVVDTNADDPRAPLVRVISGPQGERYADQRVVDTAASPEHRVVRAHAAEPSEVSPAAADGQE
jgi:HD-GYP domain-containing protein (c-di-GMP phosphodiesterase class II)